MLSDEIKEYERKLASLRSQLANCKHIFGEPYKDFDIEKVPHFHTVTQGSDIWNEVSHYSDKQIPVWRRKCTTCGHIETTTKTVAVEFKPQF